MKPWPHRRPVLQSWQYWVPERSYPKISVITPSYNQGKFLEETILSVLNQGYPNLEYIVIDGGSTDESLDVIRKYERNLTYWVSERDRGQAHAVNKGLSVASGDIIGWLNSDDLYLPWTFRNVFREFSREPELGLVWGSRMMIGSRSEVLGFSFASEFRPSTMHYCINSESAFWRASVHQKVPNLDENLHFAMDFDFFGRISKEFRIKRLAALQGCFRCYPQNKSSTMQSVCRSESALLWKKHFGLESDGQTIGAGRPYSHLRLAFYPFTASGPYLMNRLRREFDRCCGRTI